MAADRIRQLDAVITIDSFPLHLAASTGAPTWGLRHYDADWRWMVGRDDSPWYPSLRLFRQPRAGDWDDVVVSVGEAIEAQRCARISSLGQRESPRNGRETRSATSVSSRGNSG